ncbi:MAG: hypothetical protein R3274_04670 [Desulfobacterales bacterium]|nr:hypothetical protein [Desulfobacterales bacterium]
MSPSNHRIDQLCNALVSETWGDSSYFPEELNQWANHICREFILGYLNFLRQKEAKSMDWFPERLVIDWNLVDDMRHFFSDYQHITNSFLTLKRQLQKLKDIDRHQQPNAYRHMIAAILADADR